MNSITIRKYAPAHWNALWWLRFAQLAENGIFLSEDDIPAVPGLPENDEHEWDLDQIDQVYGSGGGGFWLVWAGEEAVGSVGAQDLISGRFSTEEHVHRVVELRRMYVKQAYRRRGIGAQLLQTLIDHCRMYGISAVELWTDAGGMGQPLYERFGFRQVQSPELGLEVVERATRRVPNPSEIRMQLVLQRAFVDDEWSPSRR